MRNVTTETQFVQDITADQGIGIVMQGESVEDTGLHFCLFFGDRGDCENYDHDVSSYNGTLWGADDFGSPRFCMNHAFPQEQLGYEFYMDTIESLTEEYAVWTKENDLPAMSADELLVQTKSGELDDDELITTSSQRIYLQSFINRWEEAEERE
jgi:hypothetical protein